eukprot:TRINITY_DN16954_c0_g1_i1.p1 TRINITY_DN16954_c0_g1~~TRINITY_DN16954_c0_g1_i1.p1  ORF type:complete len:296 (-),score=29.87 TRINITY_DN16954_c0_g1_i1:58-846(-)
MASSMRPFGMVAQQQQQQYVGNDVLKPAHNYFPQEPQAGDDGGLLESDEFKMYFYKVIPCSKRCCHDWTTCPYAHPGEQAARRDPRLFNYVAQVCAEIKKSGYCDRGSLCMYAHNVFEYWLHPTKYRTQLCNDGADCRRKQVCFYAHPGEKAARRDPRLFNYVAQVCAEIKKSGYCDRGSLCMYAHNVFEYWLHPTKYRTQLCNDGADCRRKQVCFFAHTLDELRVPAAGAGALSSFDASMGGIPQPATVKLMDGYTERQSQ